MYTFAGLTVAFVVSLLVSVIVTPASAGVPRVTGKATDCPGDTVTPAGRMIPPMLVKVNVVAAGDALAPTG
jgi:hypothetical protein